MFTLLVACQSPLSTPEPDTAESPTLTQTVTAAALPPGDDTQPAPFLRGSWVAHIKEMSDPDPANAHCQEGGWFTNDTLAQREALLESGQDLYVGYVDDGDTTDCWFLNFDRMLETLSPADGLLVAAGAKSAQPLETYLDLITALRSRAAQHPELVALVIDDYAGVFHGPNDPENPEAGAGNAALHARATEVDCPESWCDDPPIAFWPYMTLESVPGEVLPAIALSAGGDGVALSAAEPATLQVLLSGVPAAEDLRVLVDGVEVTAADLSIPGAPRLLSVPVPAGEVQLVLSGAAPTQLWGLRLGEQHLDPSDLDLLGGADIDAPWLADSSGVLIHQLDFPDRYHSDAFEAAVAATCAHLDERSCLMGLWGNHQWRTSLSMADQVERFAVAERHTDGVLVFRYPIDLYGGDDGPPTSGVYAEVEPMSPDYDLMGYWPAYTRGIPGFSHAWESEVECSGEHILQWSDNDGVSGRFVKALTRRLPDGEGAPVYSADVGSDGPSGELTFTAAAGERLRLSFSEIKSIGNVEVYAQFRVIPPPGCTLSWQHEATVDEEQWELWLCYEAQMRGEDCAL